MLCLVTSKTFSVCKMCIRDRLWGPSIKGTVFVSAENHTAYGSENNNSTASISVEEISIIVDNAINLWYSKMSTKHYSLKIKPLDELLDDPSLILQD